MSWDTMYCPSCGHDGVFDGRGSFTQQFKEISSDGAVVTEVQKRQTWDEFGCPECTEEFAILGDETIINE